MMHDTILHPLQSAAIARPEHIALQTDNHIYTMQTLLNTAARQASILHDMGIVAKQQVGLFGMPNENWLINFYALSLLGAVVAPLSYRMPPQAIQQAQHHCMLQHVVYCDNIPVADESVPLYHALPWGLHDARLIILSSGTTGAPHPITLTTNQLLLSAMGSAMRLGHSLDDCWLACLPLHHIGGISILLRALWGAVTVYWQPQFMPAAAATLLDASRISLVSCVPTMLASILDHRADTPLPPFLRAILLGGAKAPPALLQRCRDLSLPICLTWGMTEAASQIATAYPGDFLQSEDHDCGPPLPFVQVGCTQQGALSVSGPTIASATWPLVTNDAGRIDTQGHVHVYGRLDDVLISGGENIDPMQVEAVLNMHPAIVDALVVGLPDSTWGQRPVAIVVLHAQQPMPTLQDLLHWCCAHLPRFAIPVAFLYSTQVPRTELGKLQRKTAQKQLLYHFGSLDKLQALQTLQEFTWNRAGCHADGVNPNMHQTDTRATDALREHGRDLIQESEPL